MATFSTVLTQLLRGDTARPLITYYSDTTGERMELSVVTFGNWIAKTASLLAEEYDGERGQRLHIDLPTHWLGPVLAGAAWHLGMTVTWSDDSFDPATSDFVVCGPETAPEYAHHGDECTVIMSALAPWGVRSPDPVPEGVYDLGVEVWSQPDAFEPWDPAQPTDIAVNDTTQASWWGTLPADTGRVATHQSFTAPGAEPLWGALSNGGSVVLFSSDIVPQRALALATSERAALP